MGREFQINGPCILAAGGAGYIGSHVTVELLNAGYKVVILDNFENSDRRVAAKIPRIAAGDVTLVEGDVKDKGLVEQVLRDFQVDAVIHLAGKKSVGESVADPLLYHHDNLLGAISLLRAMRDADIPRLVFSSSATVYGVPEKLPIDETACTGVTSPYGRTKLFIEEIIEDLAASWDEFQAISLRYFNPVGAHRSGLIGESPRGIPNNLFPYVAQTAAHERDRVRVFGGDYDTPDGTGVRDFIHVVDLAKGHVRAVERLLTLRDDSDERHWRINLGTGQGYSVLEVISAFEKACGEKIPFEIVARRSGDIPISLADPSRAEAVLGWHARHDLSDMCRDHWRFQARHAGASVRPSTGFPEQAQIEVPAAGEHPA